MNPTISIITVTYNCANYLEQTIESVVNQTANIYEIVIIDGGSTDDTVEVIKKYESHISYWISEPDRGIYDAMNKGIAASKGKFLLFLNAGDTLHNHNTLLSIPFKENMNADIFYGESMIVDAESKPLGLRHKKLPHDLNWKHFKKGMVVCHQAILIHRDIAPSYDLKYYYSADIEWVLKSLKLSDHIIYTKSIISNFVEGGFSNQNKIKSWLDRFKILKENYGIIQCLISHLIFIFDAISLKLKVVKPYRKINL